jgi:hypothetical protein
MTIKSRAKINLSDGYKSNAERAWAAHGGHYLLAHFMAPVVQTYYEPFSIKLPGGSYTPDFLHILDNGGMIFVEIKGSKHQRNYRDARSKLRAAAALHPWADWIEAVGGASGFELESINA